MHSADFVPRSMSFASRYSKSSFLYPSPYRNQDAFLDCLVSNIQRLDASVLIPTYEETFLLAKHAARLSKYVAMVLPSYEDILVAHNKDIWAERARSLGIPVPESYPLAGLIEGTVSLADLRYPVLVKPKQGGGAWGIQQFDSADALAVALRSEDCGGLPWDRFFVQEKILGETHCVAMLFNKGKFRAKVAYQQLRDYPATGGQATMRVSIRSSQAEQNLQQFLEALNWHGVCQADFIVDKGTQTPFLIDLNPRLWGSLAQAIASGVDFPHLIYRMAIEGDVAPIEEFKTGVVTRWLGGELGTFFPHLQQSPERMKFLQSFFFPSTPAVLYDDFSIEDPFPFLNWLGDSLIKAVRFRSLKAVSHDSLEGIWQ